MNNVILKFTADYLVKALTATKVTEWAGLVKGVMLPIIKSHKDELLTYLKKKASDTSNTLDDAAVQAFEDFLDAFMPDTPKHL